MLMRDFVAVCDEHLIDPRLAIENDNIHAFLLGLKEQDISTEDQHEQLTELLTEQF